jgi:hypothetical protein
MPTVRKLDSLPPIMLLQYVKYIKRVRAGGLRLTRV